MGRILAIDYGTKRVGLAVTDSLQIIAGPLKTVHSAEALTFLKAYLSSEAVETIVLGEPRHNDGSLSGPREALENFEKALRNLFPEIKIVKIDERFTSKMASAVISQSAKPKKKKQDKSEIDLVAATIILQSYLEQKSFGRL